MVKRSRARRSDRKSLAQSRPAAVAGCRANARQPAVLRLLRGEDLETVSRSVGVTAATLSGWRDAFLAAGDASLATKPASGEELESERLKAKLGAALIERDLLQEKIAILEANRPLARRRHRP
jgi:transposase